MRASWMLLCIGACSSPAPEPLDPPDAGTADTSSPGDDDDDGLPGDDDDDDDATDVIPDPWEAMDPDYCASQPLYDPAWSVGTSWFVGDYRRKQDESWIGRETWQLYFNDTMADAMGMEACAVVWSATATEQDPVSCGGCGFGLQVAAVVDETATTCPEGLWVDHQSFTVDYDVNAHQDGTAEFFFASSGNPVGTWRWHGDRYTFLSEPSCRVF